MNNMFDQIDFGPMKPYLEDDDITDISYDNGGQIHLKTLSKGIFRIENPAINNTFMEYGIDFHNIVCARQNEITKVIEV